MTEDTKIKKYIKQAITELERSWEKRMKERDQKADQRIEASLKRHVGALTEDFKSQVSGIAEQYGGIKETLDSHGEMIGSLMIKATETKDTLDIVQSDVELIKNDLKQKVDRSEFEALVKRVSFVEKKLTTR